MLFINYSKDIYSQPIPELKGLCWDMKFFMAFY
jgi:hypothetical protein